MKKTNEAALTTVLEDTDSIKSICSSSSLLYC